MQADGVGDRRARGGGPRGRVGGALLLIVGLGGLAALALGGSAFVRGYLLFGGLAAVVRGRRSASPADSMG